MPRELTEKEIADKLQELDKKYIKAERLLLPDQIKLLRDIVRLELQIEAECNK